MGAAWEQHAMCESAFRVPQYSVSELHQLLKYFIILIFGLQKMESIIDFPGLI